MFGCLKARGLLAASVYDDLSTEERRWLRGHVERCSRCRMRQAEFKALGAYIPPSRPVLDQDLLPALKSRLCETNQVIANGERLRPSLRWEALPAAGGWRLAVSGVMCALAVGIFALKTVDFPEFNDGDPEERIVSRSARDEGEVVWGEMERHLEARDFTAAYRTLKQALEGEKAQPWTADARLVLADLAYEQLHWYDEAFESYGQVVQNHRQTLEAEERLADVVTRWNMLAEARKNDYASLHALHAAAESSNGDFEALEEVVARHPGTFVASEAVRAMAGLAVGEDTGEFVGDKLAALNAARHEARHPIVKAQVDYEIGQFHLTQDGDPDKARDFLLSASQCDDEALAERARKSLATLRDYSGEEEGGGGQ